MAKVELGERGGTRRGMCGCGWVGPDRGIRSLADKDRKAHEDQGCAPEPAKA